MTPVIHQMKMLRVVAEVCLIALCCQLILADYSKRCRLEDLDYPGLLKPQKDYMEYAEHFQVACDDDYYVSPGIFLCLKGYWDNTIEGGRPCLKKFCEDEPPSLKNGKPKEYDRKNGSIVDYECDEDHELEGNSSVQCAFGAWVGKPPVCKFRCAPKEICTPSFCSIPEGPEHGYVQLTENPPKVGTSAKYFCNEGKTLVGNTFSTCVKFSLLSYPRWFFAPPQCYNSCLVPDIQDGKLKVEPITNESLFLQEGEYVKHLRTATLFCPNLENGRSREVKCNDGIWSEPLDCEPKSCTKLPPKVDHGQAIIHSTTHGSTIQYSCPEEPYTVMQSFANYEVMCLFGEWEVTRYFLPKCLDNGKCKVPDVPRAKLYFVVFEGQGEEYWSWKRFKFVRDDVKIKISAGTYVGGNKVRVVCRDDREIDISCVPERRWEPYPRC